MTIQIVLYLICQRYKFERVQELVEKYEVLYLICQRYKFESESQLKNISEEEVAGCI